jgi:hypothetical protein
LISPSAAGSGVSGFLFIFSWSLICFYQDAEGPRDCGSEVFIAEEVDEVEDKE